MVVSTSNSSVANYNSQTGNINTINKGEAVIIFTYDGIFKDTMYVAVGGGGLPYPQQITTANLPVFGNASICPGSTISVPFTTSGGTFDDGNQFIVQISDTNGENFISLETTGTTSPLTAKIPNGLSNTGTSKVRVVSQYPHVLGSQVEFTNASLAISPNPPNVADVSTNWSQTATLQATGCSGSVKWYDVETGGTSIFTGTSFTTPNIYANKNYYATCTETNCESVSRGIGEITIIGTCPSMYTIKSGVWNDPTLWSCGRLPIATDVITISSSHVISVPSGEFQVKSVTNNGTINFQQGGIIKINN
jgi:Ig-like domain CHU_C associated